MEKINKGVKKVEGKKARGIEDWPFKRDRGLEGWKDSLLEGDKRYRGLEGWRASLLEGRKTRGIEGWKFNVSQFKLNFTNIAFLNSHTSIPLSLHTSKRRYAFTMAEILISLTIIGIIAAITLPSLVGNIKEKSWAAQRKALYSRMTQAISMLPSLNGYGEYEGTWNNDVVTATKDTAAQAFVTNGLSKVLQIKNICTNSELAKCGLPDKYTAFDGSKTNFPKKLSDFQPYFVKRQGISSDYINQQKNVDTAAAAFETMNGESVAVFYNPYCVDRNVEFAQPQHEYWLDAKNIYPYFCTAFMYDLNGRKGPNKMGKDMWIL